MGTTWVALIAAIITPLVAALISYSTAGRDLVRLRELATDPGLDWRIRREANHALLTRVGRPSTASFALLLFAVFTVAGLIVLVADFQRDNGQPYSWALYIMAGAYVVVGLGYGFLDGRRIFKVEIDHKRDLKNLRKCGVVTKLASAEDEGRDQPTPHP